MTSGSSFLSGDFPFDFLHSEMVRFLLEQEESDKIAIEKLEKLGEEELMGSNGLGIRELNQEETTKRLKYPTGLVNATTKLESIGYRVGYVLVEKLAKDHPRFNSELDMMKFMCKDFWSNVFRKQVDNLRTNHQGVYVIQDNKFWLLEPLSASQQYRDHSPNYLAFSCGAIRGALTNLGVQAVVTASVEVMPAVKFNVHVTPK